MTESGNREGYMTLGQRRFTTCHAILLDGSSSIDCMHVVGRVSAYPDRANVLLVTHCAEHDKPPPSHLRVLIFIAHGLRKVGFHCYYSNCARSSHFCPVLPIDCSYFNRAYFSCFMVHKVLSMSHDIDIADAKDTSDDQNGGIELALCLRFLADINNTYESKFACLHAFVDFRSRRDGEICDRVWVYYDILRSALAVATSSVAQSAIDVNHSVHATTWMTILCGFVSAMLSFGHSERV